MSEANFTNVSEQQHSWDAVQLLVFFSCSLQFVILVVWMT